MINFCTLFDYNYIDRALAMYYSLESNCEDFLLYVIPFDRLCYDTLSKLNLKKTVLIKLEDFENDELLIAKSNRSAREYLWTCSSFAIRYVLINFNLSDCTYIDSDLFFYSDPGLAINRFLKSENDVAIISHNYSDHYENSVFRKIYGKYCVEFNSFKNTNNGLAVLDWWCSKCLSKCPELPENEAFGDQKYLNLFSERFTGIYEYNDFGLGIAPWNVDDYELIDDKILSNKKTNTTGKIVFYHFHSIILYADCADINIYKRPGRMDEDLIAYLYGNYLNELKRIQSFLGKVNNKNVKDNKTNVFVRTFSYMFEEKNIIIAIRKLYRLILFRKKDVFKY